MSLSDYEPSRRDLLLGSAALLLWVPEAFAQAEDDVEILTAAVGLEQSAVFAYTAAADSGKLGESEPVARYFAQQEQEHADGLTQALRGLGGSPPPKPTGLGDVPGLAEALRGNAVDITRFAIELENMAIAAYYDAQGKLSSPGLLSTGASIMANEAQHLVVLRQALGNNPSPHAFVTGS